MTILRVGSNAKYADGWDIAFGGKKKATPKPKKTATTSKAKPAKKKKAKK